MRIDAHHHVWTLARGDYGWLTADLAPIYRDFHLSDLVPHLATGGIEGTILVQAAPTEAETRFLLDLAEEAEIVRGVVGWIDFDGAVIFIECCMMIIFLEKDVPSIVPNHGNVGSEACCFIETC